jgi:hypothetical protein
MGWIESKSVRYSLPAFTDELADSETSGDIEPLGEAVVGDEVEEVGLPDARSWNGPLLV